MNPRIFLTPEISTTCCDS